MKNKLPIYISYIGAIIASLPVTFLVIVVSGNVHDTTPYDAPVSYILPTISIALATGAFLLRKKEAGKYGLPFAYFAVLVSLFFIFVGMKGCC